MAGAFWRLKIKSATNGKTKLKASKNARDSGFLSAEYKNNVNQPAARSGRRAFKFFKLM